MQDSKNDGPPDGAPANSPPPDEPHGGQHATSESQLPAATEGAAQTAQSLANQARQTLAGKLDGQKSAAADMVEQFAQSVQRSGEQFAGSQDWIASAIDRGAQELNSLASSIRDKDVGELAGEVQSFATRRPAIFMAAAFATGFAIARVGKVIAGNVSRDDLPTIPEVGDGQQ